MLDLRIWKRIIRFSYF